MKVSLNYFKHQFIKNISIFIFMLIVLVLMDTLSALVVIPIHYLLATIFITLYFLDYQYNRHSIDHFYSAPIKRNHLFWSNLLCGYTYIILGFIISTIVVSFLPIPVMIESNKFNIIPLVTVHTLIVAWITTNSNSRVDSIVLSVIYPIVMLIFFIFISAFPDLVLYGFYDQTSISNLVINLSLIFVDTSQISQVIGYFISFIIQVILLLIIIRKGNNKRKVENAGGKIGNPKIMLGIKVISTFALFTLIVIAYGASYTNKVINLKQLFSYFINVYEQASIPLLIGLAIYLIGNFIANRKIEKTVKYIFEFGILFTVFNVLLGVLIFVKIPLFDNRIPRHIAYASISTSSSRTISVAPEIYNFNTKQNVGFVQEKSINLIKKMHEHETRNRNDATNYLGEIVISYNQDFKRRYFVKAFMKSYFDQIYSVEGEFSQMVNEILAIEEVKSIKLNENAINLYQDIEVSKVKALIKFALENKAYYKEGIEIITNNHKITIPSEITIENVETILGRR